MAFLISVVLILVGFLGTAFSPRRVYESMTKIDYFFFGCFLAGFGFFFKSLF